MHQHVPGCRIFGIHLIYLSILAAAAAACLPLVPVYLVAFPAALQLVAQVSPQHCAFLMMFHC